MLQALADALALIGTLDRDVVSIAALSLRVSLAAAGIAFLIGAPAGAWLAVRPFPGRGAVLVVLNALLGLPPVVAGLVVYLLISRSGPLGDWGLLYNPGGMVLAQTKEGVFTWQTKSPTGTG